MGKPNEHRADHQYLQCSACHTVLGIVEPHADGWKLFKWRLALGFAGHTQLDVLQFECCISDRLLSISEAQSTRKITIESDLASQSPFTVGFRYKMCTIESKLIRVLIDLDLYARLLAQLLEYGGHDSTKA